MEHLYLFGNYGRGRFGRTEEREARSGEEWEAGAVPVSQRRRSPVCAVAGTFFSFARVGYGL